MRLILVLLTVLLVGCSGLGESLGTLYEPFTPTPGVTVLPSPTEPPTAVPTETPVPTVTPTLAPAELCESLSATIICVAEECVIRTQPGSDAAHKAMSVPRGTELDIVGRCEFPGKRPVANWFWLGRDDDADYWAVDLETIWQLIQDN